MILNRSLFKMASAVLTLSLGVFTADAHAVRSGEFSHSGRAGVTCAQCHFGASGSSVSYTLSPVNSDIPPISMGYFPGAVYSVTVTVAGGPAKRFGFNWDSDSGFGTVTDTANTRKNTSPSRPSEFTHTTTGTTHSSWSFDWTAPRMIVATVNFWCAGNSTNNDNARSGDAPTASVRMQVTPLPPEILCRLGTVNDTPADPIPVLFVNGSRGDDSRIVTVPVNGPMQVSLGSYPGAPGAIPYVIYALRRENMPADAQPLPRGLGTFCFSIPLTRGSAVTVMNTLGHEAKTGTPRVPGTPLGPNTLLTIPTVPAKVSGARITLQGLVPDSTATSGGSMTNAVVVCFQ